VTKKRDHVGLLGKHKKVQATTEAKGDISRKGQRNCSYRDLRIKGKEPETGVVRRFNCPVAKRRKRSDKLGN